LYSPRHDLPYQRPDLPQACQGTIVPVAGMGVSERMQKETVLAVGLTKTVEAGQAEPSPNELD